ncbi:KCNAW-like protein [Mya arenaria]|uniref:KCNAW-like protein n=1 Tax=Mya arenaria TaxID=6604 RepID=A0ABY7DLV4_MYAAR|nr:potassium voltage-gated channel protein Shaw-like [Mya arenaria]WAQ97868.1 KCNAW-like protein [Mya arenaria]
MTAHIELPTKTQIDIIKLNIGGVPFLTRHATLKNAPDTRLARLTTSSKEYISDQNVYFFDRNPELFNYILDYYRTGELHLPKHVCGATIRNELEFWQLGSGNIADCCVASMFKFEDELEVSNNLKQQFELKNMEYSSEQLHSSKWNRLKSKLWNILERPQSTRLARIYSLMYMSFVLVTCVTFILSTHAEFRCEIYENVSDSVVGNRRLYDLLLEEHKNPKVALQAGTELIPSLQWLNDICTVFFFLELSLRILTCPRRKEFFKFSLNIVDIIIVISLVITFIFRQNISQLVHKPSLLWLFLCLRGLIFLRLLRLFRFARHFTGLKILYLALKASIEELGLLVLTFMITTALFGSLIFYAEFSHYDNISNVPIGIWWAIVTLTTVGYGDYVPLTTTGYVIGALCTMCGLLLLSMPIAVIATNFNDYYAQNKIREKQLKRKQTILAKIRNLFHFDNSVSIFRTPTQHVNNKPDNSQTESTSEPAKANKEKTVIEINGVVDNAQNEKLSNGSAVKHGETKKERNIAFKRIVVNSRRSESPMHTSNNKI